MGPADMSAPERRRLPGRRPSLKQELQVGGQNFTIDIGFDPETGAPCEVFLNAGQEGSLLGALLADAAVTISIALQHGIPAAALAKSVARLPATPVTPADLDQVQPARLPASPIGAALDFLRSFDGN